MCRPDTWICQVSFCNNLIRSPHERRGEIERMKHPDDSHRYKFLERPCEHGVVRSKDFMLVELGEETTKVVASATATDIETTLGI